LIGVYPALTLYYLNIQEIKLAAIWQAIITSLVVTIVVAVFYTLIFRSWARAALPASFTLLLIFTYGHIFNLVSGLNVAGITIGRHRTMIILWILIYAIGFYLITRIKPSERVTRLLNNISIAMTVLVVVEIGIYFAQPHKVSNNLPGSSVPNLTIPSSEAAPDVYYILIDAYSRSDLLRYQFRIDSTELTNKLLQMGFYIPQCAQSNYDVTYPSLASSLNMNYLDTLGIDQVNAEPADYQPFIHDSLVRKTFEKLGYQTVTFKSLHPAIDITDSTYYFDYFKDRSVLDQSSSLNFQYLFLGTTIFRPVIAYLEGNKDSVKLSTFWSTWLPTNSSVNSREYRQYQQNVYALESLTTIPKLPGRKFVYAHLFITHQPYVFYPDGRFHPALAQHEGAYRDQVLFANQRIPEILESILANSNLKPIIIVQSDHSFVRGPDRVKILNAYYLPDHNKQGLYDTITPVNTFRLIFNTYFGGKYEMLPDVSKYSEIINGRRQIHEVPSSCVS
jgi:hypothetical protein